MAHSYTNLVATVGAAVWVRTDNVKNTIAAGPPGVSDDETAGHEIFSRWLDTAGAPDVYECLDDAIGAAVWVQTNATGGGESTPPLIASYGGY